MKKFRIFVLACICSLMLIACSNGNKINNNDNTNNTTAETEYVFYAKVLEIDDQYLLVEPANNSYESKSSDKINISLKTINCPENLEIGDSVIIAYDGMIQELYPAIIPNVYSIKKK